jgi:hypothetical protein
VRAARGTTTVNKSVATVTSVRDLSQSVSGLGAASLAVKVRVGYAIIKTFLASPQRLSYPLCDTPAYQ